MLCLIYIRCIFSSNSASHLLTNDIYVQVSLLKLAANHIAIVTDFIVLSFFCKFIAEVCIQFDYNVHATLGYS